jgi:hypothetical protein
MMIIPAGETTISRSDSFSVETVSSEDHDVPESNLRGTSTFTLTDNPFCNSLHGALARGSSADRTMIHAFVSNSGHFPFLHNVLLTMIHNIELPWTPLILSLGEGVCPMLANVTELQGHYICVPYLERLLDQLQKYEPESVKQITTESELITAPKNDSDVGSDHHRHHTRFGNVDKTFFGWGSVEHKFLINSKLYALLDILECGADAFITDTDIGFRKDPRPYFDVAGSSGDIVAQNDTNPGNYELSINSGFMYWKRTTQNLDLIKDILTGEWVMLYYVYPIVFGYLIGILT